MSQTFRDTFATIRDIRDNSRQFATHSRQFATHSRQFATHSRQYVTNPSFHVSRQVSKKIWRQLRSLTKLFFLFFQNGLQFCLKLFFEIVLSVCKQSVRICLATDVDKGERAYLERNCLKDELQMPLSTCSLCWKILFRC